MNQTHTEASIAVLATMDTKARPAEDLARLIRDSGRDAVIIDLSVGTRRASATGVIGCAEVAHAANADWDALHDQSREDALATMARGASSILSDLYSRGELAGVVALGGGSGSWVGQTVMADLAPGLAKLIVSTSTRNDGRQSDVVFMASAVDIEGSNALLEITLRRAAAAICALAGVNTAALDGAGKAIALTMFGVTTEGGSLVRAALEEAGHEVAVFHANGAGGREMERLIAAGHFAGVVDWTTSEVIDHIAGGICDAGPTRLSAAAAAGIPQIVIPGAIDVINTDGSNPTFGSDRIIHEHVPGVLLVRSDAAENRAAGHWIGARLRDADPMLTRVLIPEGGYSSLDAPGRLFYDPEADRAFVTALCEELAGRIDLQSRPEHINSPAFAAVTAATIMSLIDAASAGQATEMGKA